MHVIVHEGSGQFCMSMFVATQSYMKQTKEQNNHKMKDLLRSPAFLVPFVCLLSSRGEAVLPHLQPQCLLSFLPKSLYFAMHRRNRMVIPALFLVDHYFC